MPHIRDGSQLVKLGLTMLAIMLVMLAMSGQLGSRICRLCLGSDMRMSESSPDTAQHVVQSVHETA